LQCDPQQQLAAESPQPKSQEQDRHSQQPPPQPNPQQDQHQAGDPHQNSSPAQSQHCHQRTFSPALSRAHSNGADCH
jgi:hypothetical protein